ncbi:MAG: serine/threonine-protein kinase [Candidatus Eremiobacterota bacterium]
MYKKCSNCNTVNSDTARFCNECAQSLMTENPQNKEFLSEGHVLTGRYVIRELIKCGGMGAIYKSEDNHLTRVCAIKELLTNWCNTEKDRDYVVKRFQSEAKLLSELHHVNLPKVTDYFICNERHYLVMDFIEGVDLESLLAEKYKHGFPLEEAINYGIEICNLLEYLHGQEPPIIYRDLKPSNIMMRKKDDRLFLIDFGIACSLEPELSASPRTMIGTMGYLSPEQYQGKPVMASDLYSLGATLYHLITGQMPIPFVYRPMRELVPSVPPYLDEVMKKALDLTIKQRFQTAPEMRIALCKSINKYDSIDINYNILLLKNEKNEKDLKKAREQIGLLKDKLAKMSSNSPFPGNFVSYSPEKLLKYLSDVRPTGKITYQSDNIKGELCVNNGKIMSISWNNWSGELAWSKFLKLKKGNFDFHDDGNPENVTRNLNGHDPLEFIQEDKKELLLTLEHIIDTIVSPDRLLRFEKNSLNNEKNIQLTRFQMKILSMITMGNSSINKLVSALNGSQLKIAETICYLKDSGFIDIEP